MAPQYKLIYFNVKSLGETIRYMLSYGGVEFEEQRVEREEWKDLKPSTPFGQLPILEENGKKATQSAAICRYLAKKFNLAGADDWQNLQIDATVDTIIDMRTAIYKAGYADEAVREQKLAEVQKETVPFFLSRLDQQVEKNGGYLVDGKLTWADVHFAATLDTLNSTLDKDLLAGYPNLKALAEKVWNLDKIKAWRAKRPDTRF